MSGKVLSIFFVAAGVLLVSSPLSAHHGVAHYDMNKTISLMGTVTAFDWGNPHCLLHLDAKDDAGNVRHWTLEMSSTSAMTRMGWERHTLKRGDEVTAEAHPAQNGTPLGITSGPGFSLKVAVNGKEIPSR
jgi:hypothetical protein